MLFSLLSIHFISFNMAFNRVQSTSNNAPRSGAAMSVDIDPDVVCYAGAAVVGGTVIVGSIGLTTMAAPAVTLVPAAVAGGLYFAGNHIRENRAIDNTDAKPASTETATA